MNQQQSMTNGDHQQREGWTGLMSSMIGFTNAATMFSIQQMQNALGLFTDSRRVINRFKHAVDSVSDAMNSEIDSSKRSTVGQMNRAANDAVNATADTFGANGDDQTSTHSQAQEESLAGRKR